MQDFDTNSIQTEEETKRPVFLTVLCVLSFISIGFGLMSSLLGMINGPISNEKLEESLVDMYNMLSFYQDQGIEVMTDFIQKTIDSSLYINNETFYLNEALGLISLLVGLVGVVFMFKQLKLGFHFYIIYSILPVVILYMVLPAELISTFFVGISLFFNAIFCLLYGLNLKYMK
ncbi:MAG: hypothetical protein ACPGU5_05520 [Lishizhenia sp.]